jgi:hypothetical protein
MKELSLHILDLIQNSIEANAKNIFLEIKENDNEIMIRIKDDGKGIPKEILEDIKSPFTTTRKTRRIGLGISLFNEIITNCGGELQIMSEPGKGTEIIALLPSFHWDLPPWGDIVGTIYSIIATSPHIDFHIKIFLRGKNFEFSTKDIKKEINGLPINHPEVLSFIHNYLKENLGGVDS